MKYHLTITTWGHRPTHNVTRAYANLSPARAWKLARRAARRGFNRFGGDIAQSNWGMSRRLVSVPLRLGDRSRFSA